MTKLAKFNQPFIIGFHLGVTGMVIQYLFQNILKELKSDPEQAAGFLKKHGLINDFVGSGDQVVVEWVEDGAYPKASWQIFIKNFTLAEWQFWTIAHQHEMDTAEKKRRERYHKVINSVNFLPCQFNS